LEEEGITFIGPKHYSIAAMGDKIASKKLANEAKVNTIPGYNDAIDTPKAAVEIAKGIGYPVMIKASAGGGGKGLRVAFNDKEAFEGFSACKNEARNSFGDDRVFIEKFVEEPRHIEIQVLGDGHGNAVYLWERECSIQRRHQKVIEEAPSPFISEETRKAMGEQAVALAKAVKYQSAGTVEFVVGKDQSFYFLEMNTRLQVEHPVTESITGLDLVEQMIRVAAGEKLSFGQGDIKRNGWSMECRINADDPYRNFLPSTGRLVRYQPPEEVNGVRVDTGVYEGGEIPMYYDSMIAKLIVHGKDRLDAITKMRAALNEFVIRGIHSNIPFQAALMQHPRFISGDFNTGFIAEEFPHGFRASDVVPADDKLMDALATAVHRRYLDRAAGIYGQLEGHEVKIPTEFVVASGEPGKMEYVETSVNESARGYEVHVAGQIYKIDTDWNPGQIIYKATVNGKAISAQVERVGLFYRIQFDGVRVDSLVLTPAGAEMQKLMPFKEPPDMSKFLLSPMPGLLVDVAVTVGQKVEAGQRLAAIEAMKMENVLVATQDGVVAEVMAAKGESLAVDQQILRFE
jgi:propionyl-CoA carboxylase alpha chain